MKQWVETRSQFFREWVRSPLQTASVIPSSRSLARKMAQSVTINDKPIIELGPGTGVFTRALLERGLPEEQLILVELNPVFARSLAEKFPRARVINGAAENIAANGFDDPVEFVISGIPLMSISNHRVGRILQSVFDVLEKQGRLVQFTYAPRCPVNQELMRQHGLKSQLRGVVFTNFPPAHIYHISRANNAGNRANNHE